VRELADAIRLEAFMRALGTAATDPGRVYLTGGATAVLHGWRSTTVDADIWLVPDSDALLRAIVGLKETLRLNVELVAPGQFLPELPGWAERSDFIAREAKLDFLHLDYYTQVLSKILRRQRKDVEDVRSMLESGLVDPTRAWELFQDVEQRLFRYPSIDPATFRRAVVETLGLSER